MRGGQRLYEVGSRGGHVLYRAKQEGGQRLYQAGIETPGLSWFSFNCLVPKGLPGLPR